MKHAIMKQFSDFVAAKGLNMSRQRALILDAFLSAGAQISVDDLFIRLRTQHPTLGRSTVYRTMKLLVESGIARRFTVDSEHYQQFAVADLGQEAMADKTANQQPPLSAGLDIP